MSTSLTPTTDFENATELAIKQAAAATLEGLLGTLLEQLLSSLQGPAVEVLRESEERLNALIASVVSERLAGVKEAAVAAVTQSVLRAMPPPSEAPPAPAPRSAELFSAITSIHASAAHAEVLGALLDSCTPFCGRCAMFVLRGTNLVGWQGRGFLVEDAVRATVLSVSSEPIAGLMASKIALNVQDQDWNPALLERDGRAHDGVAFLLPLVVRDKVVGVLFADSGKESAMAKEELQLLVWYTAQWLEITAGRKGRSAAAAAPGPSESAQPNPNASRVEAPDDAASSEVSQSEAPPAEIQPSETVSPESQPSFTRSTGVITLDLPPDLPPEEQELHRKAKRFAKLLAEEIKLYNKTKVDEGRANRDLYQRLREDIDKSRASYDKRYGNTSVQLANYFQSEIIRILAENDVALMGSDFPQ